MIKVLFVCTGNICRSPTAAAILEDRLHTAGIDDRVDVDSAGTHAFRVDEPPDPRSVAVALERGIDIGDRRARQIAAEDFVTGDLIIAMERRHARHLLKLCPADEAYRIRLLMSFVPDASFLDIPDPYVGAVGFGEVFDMIALGVDHLVGHLRHVLGEE
jgi:protein-tyrosine phosphatase